MTAAELLRGLDMAATAAPWKALLYEGCGSTFIEPSINCGNGYEGEIKKHDARLIATTRNLLPLLTGLVEVVGDVVASLDVLSKAEPHQKLEAAKVSVGAHEVLRQRLAALNAAAAKEAK